MDEIGILETLLRVVLAVAPAALIGLEREYTSQPAGLRTHILLGLGACLFALGGVHLSDGDPGRVAAQVASGVGFLGAGAILRGPLHITGLTTAASLWVTASIGVAAGLGAYSAVLVSSAIALIVLAGLRSLERRLPVRRGPRLDLVLGIGQAVDQAVDRVRGVLPAYELKSVHPTSEPGGHRIVGNTHLSRGYVLADVVADLQALPGVTGVEMQRD